MRFLLDTHVVLWWLGNETMTDEAVAAISDPNHDVLVSAASVWEISIKSALGKLSIPQSFAETLGKESFAELAISWEHAVAVRGLPDHHRDPFDRVMIAQCQVHGLTMITRDADIPKYEISTIVA